MRCYVRTCETAAAYVVDSAEHPGATSKMWKVYDEGKGWIKDPFIEIDFLGQKKQVPDLLHTQSVPNPAKLKSVNPSFGRSKSHENREVLPEPPEWLLVRGRLGYNRTMNGVKEYSSKRTILFILRFTD